MGKHVCLADLSCDRAALVMEIQTSHSEAARLAPLGIVRGSRVEMLRNARRGAVLVEVRNTVVALARTVAQNILIGEVDHDAL